jgi:hypothetical protein
VIVFELSFWQSQTLAIILVDDAKVYSSESDIEEETKAHLE